MFTRHPWLAVLVSVIAATVASIAFSDAPPANTIPIIAERPTFDDITLELLCTLSWMHFDAVNRFGYNPPELLEKLVEPAEEAGLYVILSPWTIGEWTNYWARISLYDFVDHDSAYAYPGWYDPKISTCSGDTLLESKSVTEMRDSLEAAADTLAKYFEDQDNVWFYLCFDEAPARQWNRMVNDSVYIEASDTTIARFFDDYIPNMFTQAMDSVYRPELSDDSLWLPTLEEVEPTGMVSWLKWELEDAESYHPMTITFSGMHTVLDWAGMNNTYPPFNPPSCSDQATAVRSFLNMEYQGYGDPMPVPVDNFPEFFTLDSYPFRLVGIAYQDTANYTPTLGDSLGMCIFDQYVEATDSTFIPAREIAVERGTDIPIIYWPQAFGRVGGIAMWDTAYIDPDTLIYMSGFYRIPTPQEFLMNCNVALLRGAKGIQPFCLASYDQGTYSVLAGHLDRNHVPFDAPYEEWVYRDRPSDDFYYIPPDSIAPFIDGFDPLYDLPSRPEEIPNSERNVENYLLWKFEPYGRLWNSMEDTFGQIAGIAPEMYDLWWFEDDEGDPFWDVAVIAVPDSDLIDYFVSPEIKIFRKGLNNHVYLFYVNRFCRYDDFHESAELPVEITIQGYIPDGYLSETVLDHSRRCIFSVWGGPPHFTYSFEDTLEAGGSRLIEFVDYLDLPADIRVTSPDVFCSPVGILGRKTELRCTAGTSIDIGATFYNMGLDSAGPVVVTFRADDQTMGTDTISFSGLSQDYQPDSTTASIRWNTDSDDIGVHLITISAVAIQGEPDTQDNSVQVAFLVDPSDYASEVLNNPWDMNEATTRPIPDWYTNDIEDVSTWWDTSSGWTDSVSGMFEGVLDTDISGNLLRGDISLSIPEDSTIDVDDYFRLSLAAVCMNPNGNATTAAGCVLHLRWIDSHGDTLTANLSTEVGAIRNGTDQWQIYGPIDLRLVTGLGWSNKEASEVWLSFRTGKPDAPEIPKPVDIRLGWVRLTE